MEEKGIKDLVKLKTYTIDSLTSKEIDDAISLDITYNKKVIWIHIFNPSEIINKESSIIKTALNKSISLYMAEETINMLPISQNKKLAGFNTLYSSKSLSASIIINEDGSIQSYELCRSIVQPNFKLSYEDAEELIELEPKEEIELNHLYQLMLKRREYRLKNGAIILEQNQGSFIESISHPKLRIIEKTKSRFLIEELMILMGYILSLYSLKNNIPNIYRCQQKTNIKKNNLSELSVFYESYIKKKLKKAFYTNSPASHFTLGLDCYLHGTSPIRRYSDFVVHSQISNYIKGENIYTKHEISQIIDIINKNIFQNNEKLKLEQNKCKLSYFNDNIEKLYKVHFIYWVNMAKNIMNVRFDELEMDIAIKVIINKELKLGDLLIIQYQADNLESYIPIFVIGNL